VEHDMFVELRQWNSNVCGFCKGFHKILWPPRSFGPRQTTFPFKLFVPFPILFFSLWSCLTNTRCTILFNCLQAVSNTHDALYWNERHFYIWKENA